MSDEQEYNSPMWGRNTGAYMVSEDGCNKVAGIVVGGNSDRWNKVTEELKAYKWNEGDFILCSYPKTGTHFGWEVMTMLLRNSAEYIKEPKEACMMDMFPLSATDKVYPRGAPRVLNTHYRLDVLPKEFQGRKTVVVTRNPKDTVVSMLYHMNALAARMRKPSGEPMKEATFSEFLRQQWTVEDQPYGTYFEYYRVMWDKVKENPSDVMMVYFEDMKTNPVAVIQAINSFMGTGCSQKTIKEIAEATSFKNMKKGKSDLPMNPIVMETLKSLSEAHAPEGGAGNPEQANPVKQMHKVMYRKGEIGDWKNHFTVAENEWFEELISNWAPSKEMQFKYE